MRNHPIDKLICFILVLYGCGYGFGVSAQAHQGGTTPQSVIVGNCTDHQGNVTPIALVSNDSWVHASWVSIPMFSPAQQANTETDFNRSTAVNTTLYSAGSYTDEQGKLQPLILSSTDVRSLQQDVLPSGVALGNVTAVSSVVITRAGIVLAVGNSIKYPENISTNFILSKQSQQWETIANVPSSAQKVLFDQVNSNGNLAVIGGHTSDTMQPYILYSTNLGNSWVAGRTPTLPTSSDVQLTLDLLSPALNGQWLIVANQFELNEHLGVSQFQSYLLKGSIDGAVWSTVSLPRENNRLHANKVLFDSTVSPSITGIKCSDQSCVVAGGYISGSGSPYDNRPLLFSTNDMGNWKPAVFLTTLPRGLIINTLEYDPVGGWLAIATYPNDADPSSTQLMTLVSVDGSSWTGVTPLATQNLDTQNIVGTKWDAQNWIVALNGRDMTTHKVDAVVITSSDGAHWGNRITPSSQFTNCDSLKLKNTA